MTPRLARIDVFPVKSLDGVSLTQAKVHGGGGLARDREFQLADAEGRPANGKRFGEKIISLRAAFDLVYGRLSVSDGEGGVEGRLPGEEETLAAWMSDRLGAELHWERDAEKGFPDDVEASGPTVISTATLETAGGWFGLSVEEARRRFRANLEIDGVEPFWEDRLYGAEGEAPRFRIGDVELEALNPCKRCAVPSRDSRTGEIPEPKFTKLLSEKRKAALPEWAEASRFDHFYRLAVNTRVPERENGKVLEVGDEIRLAT